MNLGGRGRVESKSRLCYTKPKEQCFQFDGMIMMKKIRLYFDTSTLGKMFNPKTSYNRRQIVATRKMFQYIEANREQFELVVSPVVVREIKNCPIDILGMITALMLRIRIEELSEIENADELVSVYLDGGVLKVQQIDDLTHIAYATLNRCDYILSWNFKHFVNPTTIESVRLVNDANGHSSPTIISPFSFNDVKNATNKTDDN
jgi:hypothetical protein